MVVWEYRLVNKDDDMEDFVAGADGEGEQGKGQGEDQG